MPTADELISPAAAAGLVRCLEAVAPQRELSALRRAATSLAGVGLRARNDLLREALLTDLPAAYADFDKTVRSAMDDPEFTGWMIWPVTDAVATRALASDDPRAFDDALALLADLTPRLTAEFALRRLLNADLDRALADIQGWTAHPDAHVRRLASEGTRPRLPWAVRVKPLADRPEATVPILDALYRDPSEYVRRSVANHLNDVSHTSPELAVRVATAWAAAPDGTTTKVVRHALRTLVKQGHPGALGLLGFPPPAALTVSGPVLGATALSVGDELPFEVTLTNDSAAETRLAVDYVVHYRKANGGTAPKVFKLTTVTLAPGETVVLARRRSFKPITTRTFHAGEHALEVQVNGVARGRAVFQLQVPPEA
ncbi:DNA alkylation repair protein [Streptomyces sp. NBC_01317]|uniref:DNA alkylation repair protein n=1 Tax=Streptomyces sp. NBC_01317 TaxID=2903822 RepID=UPI002E0E05B4|nr:DNA alkylation repair protein [Streptomyces sp. NBC_01317]